MSDDDLQQLQQQKMADKEVVEIGAVNDLDSLAVQFGQSLMESDWKTYNDVDNGDASDAETDPEDQQSRGGSLDKGSMCEYSEQNSLQSSDMRDGQFDTDVNTSSNDVGNNNGSNKDPALKIYTCADCGLTYDKSSSFSNHRLTHHPSICTHCGRRFSMKSSLESHLQLECGLIIKTSMNSFECHICKKILSSKKILSRHLRRHTGIGKFTCRFCTEIFALKSELDSHLQKHEKIKPFRCIKCCMTFSERSTVVRHVKKQHGEEDYKSCIESTLQPASQVDLANQFTVHGFQLFGANGDNSAAQSDDSNDRQGLNVASVNHSAGLLSNNDGINNIQDYYDKNGENIVGTPEKSAIRKLLEEEPIGFKFKSMENDTDDDGNIREDEDMAKSNDSPSTGQKIYSCKVCNKVYNHSSSLAKHVKVHWSQNMMCHICQNQFESRHDLLTHMSVHYGGKNLSCPLCDVKFSGRSSILRHLRRSHNFSHDGAREVLKKQENGENNESLGSENFGNFENESGDESEYNMEAGTSFQTDLENTNDLESENSLDPTASALDSNMDSGIVHFTCSLCQQIFLEKSEWKTHLCLVHRLSPTEAEDCIKFEESTNFKGMPDFSMKTKIPEDPIIRPKKRQKADDGMMNAAINVTLEKDENGVTKVVKVMPEMGDMFKFKTIKTPENHTKPYSCSLCGTRFVEKSSVRRHLKRTHKFTPEEASEYMIQADYQKDMHKLQQIEIKPEKPLNETHEGVPISTDLNLTNESDIANNSKNTDASDENANSSFINQTFGCTVCDKRFMIRSSVRRHMRKVHGYTIDDTRQADTTPVLPTDPDVQSADMSEENAESSAELCCKFCTETFGRKAYYKYHLMAVHSLTAEKAIVIAEAENKESSEAKYKCGLCLSMFKLRSSLKYHLIKLHRLSDIVAERILVGEQRKDYTEGIGNDMTDISTEFTETPEKSASEDFDSIAVKDFAEKYNYTLGFDGEATGSENLKDDINNFSDNDLQGNDTDNVAANIIGMDKDMLLSEMNFNAINPWGTDIKAETDEVEAENVSRQEGEAEIDFMMSENEKLTIRNEESDAMDSSLMNTSQDNPKFSEGARTPGFPFLRVYDCPICGKIMSDASARAKHIRRHEGLTGFKCQICDQVYRQVRLIESHLKTHTGIGLKCGVCFIYCAERHSAKRHLKRIHNLEPNTEISDKNILQCTKDVADGVEINNKYKVLDLMHESDRNIMNNLDDKDQREEVDNLMSEKDASKGEREGSEVTNGEESENDNGENVFSDFLLNPKYISVEKDSENRKGGKKKTKIDSLINTLHKKIKDTSENDTDDQSDVDSQAESEYSATNTSPLKFKFTKKIHTSPSQTSSKSSFKMSNLLGKRGHNDSFTTDEESGKFITKHGNIACRSKDLEESTGYEGCDNEDDNDDDNDSDSDQTVDLDYDTKNLEDGTEQENGGTKKGNIDIDKNIGFNNGNLNTDMAMLDQEILKAIMPHMDNNTLMLDGQGTVGMDTMEPSSTGETDNDGNKPKVKHLKCWECNKGYSNYKSYREHRRKKHPLSCTLCHQVFVDIILYQGHMDMHATGNKNMKNHDCPVCGKEFKDASSRAKHIRLHTGEKPYRCEVCGKRFTQTGHLQSHMRIHNGEKPFDCKLCGKYFTEKSSVKRHLRKMHYNQYNKKCTVCGIISKTREEHRDHIVTHKLKVYTCELCFKDFLDSRGLKVHVFNAHSQITNSARLREYRCIECDKQFFSTKGLKSHLRRHKNPLPSFKCGVCSKVFLNSGHLQNHMNSHLQKKEYFCEDCGKVFNNSAYLTVHKKFHIIEKLNNIAKMKESNKKLDINTGAINDLLENDTTSNNLKTGKSVKEEIKTSKTVIKQEIIEDYVENDPQKISELNEGELNVDTNTIPSNLGSDLDIKDIRTAFSDSMVKVQKFKLFSSYYFFKSKKGLNLPEITETEDKEDNDNGDVSPSEDTPNDAAIKTDWTGKSRCLTVYRCSVCHVFQLTKKNMVRHHDSVHQARKFQCTTCPSSFSSKVMLTLHLKRSHTTAEVHKCQTCSKTFTARFKLKRHEKRHTGELPHECMICGKRFNSPSTLRFHMEAHSSTLLQCKKCGTKFVHQRSYDNHQRAMCLGNRKRLAYRKLLNKASNVPVQTVYYVCNYCGLSFNQRKSMEDHVLKYHADHPGLISEAFTEKMALKKVASDADNIDSDTDDNTQNAMDSSMLSDMVGNGSLIDPTDISNVGDELNETNEMFTDGEDETSPDVDQEFEANISLSTDLIMADMIKPEMDLPIGLEDDATDISKEI